MNPLNPEAGATPFPADATGLALAQRAAATIWRAVPYFAWRFGERGRRFGASDSAWLATLHSLPAAVQLEQVDWLARVLAQRAIPSYLLELQLTLLGRNGARVRWPGSAPTLTLAATLRARRLHALPDFSAYGLRFALSASCHRSDAHGAGLLVAAAAIDLASGLTDSAATVTDWFKNPAIFSPQWITAVDATFSSASQALRSGG